MEKIIKIQCPCGQENELVESPEGLRYNAKRHGNGEPCKGLCFNCHKPLKGLPESEKDDTDNGETGPESRDDKRAKREAKTSKKKTRGKKAEPADNKTDDNPGESPTGEGGQI